METEEPDEMIPPSKGYNLDFLDKLDDPNFNPFETKSGVTVSFSESAPVPGANIETSEAISAPSKEAQPAEEPAQPARKPMPKKPWLKNKKKIEGGESEKVKKVPSKSLPAKPWLQKKSTVTAPAADEPEIKEENAINPPEEVEEEVKVPSKGYNLDFLDNLDDPNLNPFQTKTAIVDKFDDSPPVTETETIPTSSVGVETGSLEPETSVEKEPAKKSEDVKPKKELPPKPWLKKAKKPAAKQVTAEPAKEEAAEGENKTEEEIRVPSKGYNLDFLDNLDDPNFNPFQTKTAVIDKFEDSPPVSEHTQPSLSDDKDEDTSVEKTEEEKKSKKEMPVKPWLKAKKKPSKAPGIDKEADQPNPVEECPEEKVPSKGYSLDFLDNLDDPNFNPFETKTSIVQTFDEPSEPTPEAITSQDVSEPFIDAAPDTNSEEAEQPQNDLKETEDSKTTSGGYKLDFLDNLDDPNFNPFETKSNVANTEPVEVTPPTHDPESGSDTTLVLDTEVTGPENGDTVVPDTNSVIESNDLNSTVTKDSTPEFEDREAEMLAPAPVIPEPVRAESPQSNSSGYSSIPPAPEPELSFVIPEPANIEELLKNDDFVNDTVAEMTMSDFPTNQMTMSDLLTNQSQMTGELDQLAKMGLLHEERLLSKDKEVARLNAVVRAKQAEVDQLRIKLEMKEDNNSQMMVIVDEFEKTIQQMIKEKERSQVVTRSL